MSGGNSKQPKDAPTVILLVDGTLSMWAQTDSHRRDSFANTEQRHQSMKTAVGKASGGRTALFHRLPYTRLIAGIRLKNIK